MAKYIGRRATIWIAKETTRGTPVTTAMWMAFTDLTAQDRLETIQDESALWVIADTSASHVVKRRSDGDITANLETNSFGFILLWLLWATSSEVATTWAYDHTFTVQESNQHPSLTLWYTDPNRWSVSFALSMISSVTITANVGEFVTVTINTMWKPSASWSPTVTMPAQYKLLAKNSTFKFASNLAWLSGASNTCLESFTITITKNVVDEYCLGSISPTDFHNQQFTVEGSFTAVYNDTASYEDKAMNGDNVAMQFTITDSNTTIWVSSNPWVVIRLPLVAYTDWTRNATNNEIVKQEVNFKALWSATDGSQIEDIVLTNTTASY